MGIRKGGVESPLLFHWYSTSVDIKFVSSKSLLAVKNLSQNSYKNVFHLTFMQPLI